MEIEGSRPDMAGVEAARHAIASVCSANNHGFLIRDFRLIDWNGGHAIYRNPTDNEDCDLCLEIPHDVDAARDLGTAIALDLVRQHERAKTLREEGGHHANPSWSLTITATMHHALKGAGYNPKTAGVMASMRKTLGADEISLHKHQGNGLHYDTSLEVRTPVANFAIKGNRSLTVELQGRDMPDTVLSSLFGRPIRDVIGHHVLEKSDAVIRSVDRTNGRIVFVLDDEFVSVSEPPAGIDVGWLGMGRTL